MSKHSASIMRAHIRIFSGDPISEKECPGSSLELGEPMPCCISAGSCAYSIDTLSQRILSSVTSLVIFSSVKKKNAKSITRITVTKEAFVGSAGGVVSNVYMNDLYTHRYFTFSVKQC